MLSPERLEVLRILLIVGFLLVCLLAGLMYGESLDAPKRSDGRRAATKAYCPLHRTIVGECPPGSHDA